MRENNTGDSDVGVHDFREMDGAVKEFSEHQNFRVPSSTQLDT